MRFKDGDLHRQDPLGPQFYLREGIKTKKAATRTPPSPLACPRDHVRPFMSRGATFAKPQSAPAPEILPKPFDL